MKEFFNKRKWWLVFLLVAGVLIAAYAVKSRSAAASTTQYETETIARGDLTATIGATGAVRAKQSAVLIWQAAGTVDVVNVKVGDNIPADFVLAYLQKTSLPQSVILAEADLASAQQSLNELLNSDTALAQSVLTLRDAQEAYKKAYNWRQQLNGKYHIKEIIYKTIGNRKIPVLKEYMGYASEATKKKADEDLALAKAKLDDAQREYDRLAGGNIAEIAAAQARVDAAQATINLARLTSPFAATVTEAIPLPGDQVSAGASAFRLDDMTSLLVDVEVSEVDINSVAVGQPVTLSFDAILDRTYHGEVVQVAQAGTDSGGVVSFKVTVELTDADQLVKPGMTAAVNILVNELADVPLVPNRAVRVVDGKRVIYLLKNGAAVRTEISLGASGDTVSVIAGGDVQVGDVVILNPPLEFTGPGGGPGGGPGN